MRPALFFGVIYVVFSLIVDVGENVAHYPALLLTGMILFFFFQEATGGAVPPWSTTRTSSARSSSRGWRSRCRSC